MGFSSMSLLFHRMPATWPTLGRASLTTQTSTTERSHQEFRSYIAFIHLGLWLMKECHCLWMVSMLQNTFENITLQPSIFLLQCQLNSKLSTKRSLSLLLSVSVSPVVCLCLSCCLSLSLSLLLSVSVSVSPVVCLSACLSVCLS